MKHNYNELLEQNLDAVFICAINNVLADFTIKALAKGIHVFCEKPPAKNTQELSKVMAVWTSAPFNHFSHSLCIGDLERGSLR